MGHSRRTTAYVVAACLGLAAPAPAFGDGTGGAAYPAATPLPAGHAAPAPLAAPAPPAAPGVAIAALRCVRSCGPGGAARIGSLERLKGKGLRQADQVVFLGAAGAADDVAAPVSKRRATSTDVRVPLGAPAGPVAVLTRAGAQSAPSAATLAPAVAAARPPATPSVELAVRTPRAFYAAAEPAGLTYVLHAAAPAPVGIDLVRLADGVVVGHWDAPAVAPEVPQVVTWDGTSGGLVQPAGRYAFRATVGSVAAAAQVEPPGQAAFAFATDRFPIVGPHRFGTGAAAFGGARHHQGQDTFAACGTPLVAAHGGVVKHAGWQSAAGNYLVIDNAGSGTDYVYMHLRAPALVSQGRPVLTGQPIGFVGDTGDADGCHLHFEIWTAPGWYTGGHPIDPLPFLEAWDR